MKVPMLMKATSDNETPTPGYLYQEINSILSTSDSFEYLSLNNYLIINILTLVKK